jgi:hypothetical protein
LAWVTTGEGRSLKTVSLAKFTILRVDSPEPIEGFEPIRISFIYEEPSFPEREKKPLIWVGKMAGAANSLTDLAGLLFKSSNASPKVFFPNSGSASIPAFIFKRMKSWTEGVYWKRGENSRKKKGISPPRKCGTRIGDVAKDINFPLALFSILLSLHLFGEAKED